MRTPRRAEPNQAGPLSVVALAATVLVLVVAGGQIAGSSAVRASSAETWRGLVGGETRPEIAVGQRVVVLLKAPSLAERVARAGGRAADTAHRRWTAAAKRSQKELFERLSLHGVAIKPEYAYTRVVNGFSAAVDPRAIPILERSPEVAGVYPVRAAYPASVSSSLRRGLLGPTSGRTDVTLPGYDGRGVVVALLDTGVDRSHPYLRGRVRPGIDVLSRDGSALAEAHPDDPNVLERHGTQMAGLLVGSGGPAGLSGVARGATVLPIRVAGWQRDAAGRWAVYGRTDQLLAGLERAVDPNGDGVAHDAARIALVALAEPYDAFATTPTARAVAGAAALDTLVVTAAGNDGPAGPSYGSLSGPGGAPAGLTVGAADVRRETEELRVVMRAGLEIAYAGIVPLAGVVAPERPRTLVPAGPVERAAPGADADEPPALADFFDERGFSRVAGRVALVRGGARPADAVRRAATAGAAAVLVYGSGLPAGGLGLDESIAVPVAGVPAAAARRLLDALDTGASAAVTLSAARRSPAAAAERVAEFSSRGLAFDGGLKPELLAPGVGLTTSDAGVNEDGSGRFGTVNGTSAAAAVAAGAAALLAQARPGLGAAELKGLLVGTARSVDGEPVTAQGAGLLDLGAAVAGELVATPAALGLGHVEPGNRERVVSLTLRNVSTRPLHVALRGLRASRSLVFAVDERELVIAAGAEAVVPLRATARPGAGAAEGVLVAAPDGAPAVRVPWAAAIGAPPAALLHDVQLSAERFRPSDAAPSVLTFQAGAVATGAAGDRIHPVERLDVELWTVGPNARNLGTLARLRNLLPGRYAFGLTGRGPAGAVLKPGRYRLELVATPTEGGEPGRTSVPFSLAK